MAKSHRKHMEKIMNGSDVYFQSSAFNQRIFDMYRQWLTALAMSRFHWVNLPASCDERYLECTLFYNGMATIAFPKGHNELVYTTQMSYAGLPNIYDNPTKWQSIGNNGWNFNVSNQNGVIVYDNRQRLPIAPHLEMYARRLTAMDRTLDINMLQQRTPFFLTGPQEKKSDISNIAKQYAGGEPLFVGYSPLTENIKFEAVNLNIPCIATEIDAAKRSLWNDIYRFLGIPSVEQKAERMIVGEVDSQNASSEITALDPLNTRREAADQWNRLTYHTAARADQKPVEVVWAKDMRSDNFEMENNKKIQAEVDDA